eukprot:TRINITY_DN41681_c0_g1_i1.p1 TRINITY_DN41681_c0_g1~~TRINITY_DN41681_c0_g1_i1.p1  ORF type:complete len:1240 (-),score=268.53 TRINITY_DN41681_c0_g1_i1:177-3896(-)
MSSGGTDDLGSPRSPKNPGRLPWRAVIGQTYSSSPGEQRHPRRALSAEHWQPGSVGATSGDNTVVANGNSARCAESSWPLPAHLHVQSESSSPSRHAGRQHSAGISPLSSHNSGVRFEGGLPMRQQQMRSRLKNSSGGSADRLAFDGRRPTSRARVLTKKPSADWDKQSGSPKDGEDAPWRAGGAVRSRTYSGGDDDDYRARAVREGQSPPQLHHQHRTEVVRSEVQLTKNFLKKEIEARQWKLLSAKDKASDPNLLPEENASRKLIVVTSKLPYVFFHNEETGEFEHQRDEYELNIADILTDVFSATPRRSSSARNLPLRHKGPEPTEVMLIGTVDLRRKSDNTTLVASEALWVELEEYIRRELKAVPVILPQSCSSKSVADWVIFQLFHYTTPSYETGLGSYDWEGYELASCRFRDVVLKEYSSGDLVWINDHSLMLLPKLLRKECYDIHIGFYLNCVFPSSEVYRILPQREDLLRGVLSSNVIGFHTFQYVRHFLTGCTRVLGLECTANGIEACSDAGGTHTKVISVPLGLNTRPYESLLKQEETRLRCQDFRDTFQGYKIIVAVDGLEEKKGIPHKIMAFHKFLQKEPSWAQKCVYIQIVVDNNVEDVGAAFDEDGGSKEKQKLLQQVYQMVGEVNSTFGTIGHLPVHFLCQEFSHTDLAALFMQADVLMDTPLRDMFSQAAHEFIFCQEEDACGVLILSEFSGSAQSLRAAALCVNPWDTNAFADAIQEALEMEHCDRADLHRYGHRHVKEYTMQTWASNFLDELQTAESECENERLQIPPQLDHSQAVGALRKANRRIIILGFSSTLIPRRAKIHANIQTASTVLSKGLRQNLQVIAEDANTDLVVLSGFARDTLAKALHDVPCWIIAEGGFCYKSPAGEDWTCVAEAAKESEWMAPVKEIMAYFAARTPGSIVVETESNVQWLYQQTQGDHAAIQSKDLLIHLWAGPLLSAPAEVIVGMDSVSVRHTGVGKATLLEKVLQIICCEDGNDKPKPEWLNGEAFAMCVSDVDMRDEDVFTTVQKFFEKEEHAIDDKADKRTTKEVCHSSLGGLSAGISAHAWDPRGHGSKDHMPNGDENFEVNSKSLDAAYSNYSMAALAKMLGKPGQEEPEGEDQGLFGLHTRRGRRISRIPEGEGHFDDGLYDVFPSSQEAAEAVTDASDGPAVVFTCTVNRKATRAAYHLSDTNDVSFLLAQIARELRHVNKTTTSPVIESVHPRLESNQSLDTPTSAAKEA